MARYHVNPETGNANVCSAKLRCRFGGEQNHFDSKQEARLAYERSQQIRGGRRRPVKNKSLPPILLDPPTIPYPLGLRPMGYEFLEEATDSELEDYYEPKSYSSPTSLDYDRAMEMVLGASKNDWPPTLTALVEENRTQWADIDNWDVDFGYYEGDSVTVTEPADMNEAIERWYYAQPNAQDRDGILEHVREKGHDTTSLTPLEAVKKMLRDENGMELKRVEQARQVRLREYKFDRFALATAHYERIEAREPKPVSPRSKEIMGVIYDAQTANLAANKRLLDGHHRVKDARNRGRRSGLFLVLS